MVNDKQTVSISCFHLENILQSLTFTCVRTLTDEHRLARQEQFWGLASRSRTLQEETEPPTL